jgi:hypothetical protein
MTLIVGAIMIVVASVAPASAGNLLMQIECGNPPKLQPSEHVVRVVNFERQTVDVRGELVVPMEGQIEELWIGDRRVTLKDGKIYRGFVETEEFGWVFFFLSSSMGKPGYFVVMAPQQLDLVPAFLAGN